jgi:hypothetical protein
VGEVIVSLCLTNFGRLNQLHDLINVRCSDSRIFQESANLFLQLAWIDTAIKTGLDACILLICFNISFSGHVSLVCPQFRCCAIDCIDGHGVHFQKPCCPRAGTGTSNFSISVRGQAQLKRPRKARGRRRYRPFYRRLYATSRHFDFSCCVPLILCLFNQPRHAPALSGHEHGGAIPPSSKSYKHVTIFQASSARMARPRVHPCELGASRSGANENWGEREMNDLMIKGVKIRAREECFA